MVEATVQDILRSKGSDVQRIGPDATLSEAVTALHDHRIGALVVSSDGSDLVGIMSERDIVRGLATSGRDVLDASVASVMTSTVETCVPEDSIAVVMARMTTGRFRHLPVVVDGELLGVVSIGDVVKHRVGELELEARQLLEFIQAR